METPDARWPEPFRRGSAMPTLVLCGPGNNGGDGMSSRVCWPRRVAGDGPALGGASGGTMPARRAARGAVPPFLHPGGSRACRLVIDAVFGGPSRDLDPAVAAVCVRASGRCGRCAECLDVRPEPARIRLPATLTSAFSPKTRPSPASWAGPVRRDRARRYRMPDVYWIGVHRARSTTDPVWAAPELATDAHSIRRQ